MNLSWKGVLWQTAERVQCISRDAQKKSMSFTLPGGLVRFWSARWSFLPPHNPPYIQSLAPETQVTFDSAADRDPLPTRAVLKDLVVNAFPFSRESRFNGRGAQLGPIVG